MTVVHQCRALFGMFGRFSECERSDDPRPGDGQAMPDAVRRLRRGFARCSRRVGASQKRWREVSFAGMAGGDGMALMRVIHEGIDRRWMWNSCGITAEGEHPSENANSRGTKTPIER
jgi:hypothetical protein